MTNIYDNFRSVQTKRTECYDKRSAAFISTGKLSQDIYHVEGDAYIKAALVFNYKEGPDEVVAFTYVEDDVSKADYFTYDNVYYLVYENVKLTDNDITYKKQKAVECNITFNFNNVVYNGYFTSSKRTITDNDFVGKTAIMPDETPLLILPSNLLEIGNQLTIGGKPWKVMEYDSITNAGITYVYLERDYLPEVTGEVIETETDYMTITDYTQPADVLEDPAYVQDAPGVSALSLNPMTEYTFTTVDAYFVTSPRVEIISRKSTEVVFRVPYGISEVSITIKDGTGLIGPTIYEVVL